MKVKDLIIKLQEEDPELQVLIDCPTDGDMFKFMSIETAERIITDEEEDFILISPFTYNDEDTINLN